MGQKTYDEQDDRECSNGGAVLWLILSVIYSIGLMMACLAGALLAGWRG